nr:aminodeoxychorismate synthase component I [Sphingopyxis sp.]
MNDPAAPASITALAALSGPFILFDDARSTGGAADARLFTDPVEVIRADDAATLDALLDAVRRWQAAGHYAAGFITYEAGALLEPSLAAVVRTPGDGLPMAWFARFAQSTRIAADRVEALLPDPAGAVIGPPMPRMTRADYEARVARVLDHIRRGDIYQANLTFTADVALRGDPLSAYAALRAQARAGYGGIIHTGDHWLLSHSPELFFAVKDGQIMARPMKGTATRAADPAEDAGRAAALAADAKQRAENLMIVDLLRNDLSRIAAPGSVDVPTLFRVETYPTIHQMVSDVTARLPGDVAVADVLRHIFPCGSITGAPKIRSMEIIGALEDQPRGVYTGSMGFVAPDGEAAFNVAIRTLVLPTGGDTATLGLGSGIVDDSRAADEWHECLAKGRFVERAAGMRFDLIETMAFDPMDGFPLLDRHLERLSASARAFGFAFDRHGIRNMLQHATFRQDIAARVRLRLSRGGAVAIACDPAPPVQDGAVTLLPMPRPVAQGDVRLQHKMSARSFYDDTRRMAQERGAFDALLHDTQGRVTEGCITSIFVERDGMLLTPPLALSLLPGVLRADLIAAGRAVEAE